MSVKDQRRLDRVTGLECKDGRLFIDAATAALTDLSGVRLLRCGVDTVRKLYKGLIRPEIMSLFDNPGTMVDFAGQRWHSGRVGRDSGYQYKLQNADLGIILLVKNFNAKLDSIGPPSENRSVAPCHRQPFAGTPAGAVGLLRCPGHDSR